jgi:hypothetical protein
VEGLCSFGQDFDNDRLVSPTLFVQALLKLLLHAFAHPSERPHPPPAEAALPPSPSSSELTAPGSPPPDRGSSPSVSSSSAAGSERPSAPPSSREPVLSSASTPQCQDAASGPPATLLQEPAVDAGKEGAPSEEPPGGSHLAPDCPPGAGGAGESPRGSPPALLRLVHAHLGPLLRSEHTLVQERAANVVALLDLLASEAAPAALQLLAGVGREELRPVAARAQSLVTLPEGLQLESSLEAVGDGHAQQGAHEWGPQARVGEGAAGDAPQLVEAGGAAQEARAARAEHRQRHGQYYLPTEEPHRLEDTWRDEGPSLIQQGENPGLAS